MHICGQKWPNVCILYKCWLFYTSFDLILSETNISGGIGSRGKQWLPIYDKIARFGDILVKFM